MILLKTWLKFELFQIFKILLITVVVLVLGGGIGEISSLFAVFLVKFVYFAVFERHGIKNFVVATASVPSPYGELRDHLEAETVPSKTKLMAFANSEHDFLVDLAALNNPITIDNTPVEFCTEAEHVGIIRSTTGNMPNILHRVACHKKSLGSLLSAGLTRSHRDNPAASLRVHRIYASSVLFSGLAALVLTKAEIKIIDAHFLCTLQNLQRLHDKTPRAVVLSWLLVFLVKQSSIPGN